jgi:hypothetical protein
MQADVSVANDGADAEAADDMAPTVSGLFHVGRQVVQ